MLGCALGGLLRSRTRSRFVRRSCSRALKSPGGVISPRSTASNSEGEISRRAARVFRLTPSSSRTESIASFNLYLSKLDCPRSGRCRHIRIPAVGRRKSFTTSVCGTRPCEELNLDTGSGSHCIGGNRTRSPGFQPATKPRPISTYVLARNRKTRIRVNTNEPFSRHQLPSRHMPDNV